MKRWYFLLTAFLILKLLPAQRTEVSRLLPAELLYVSYGENGFYVQTDTGEYGEGLTIEAALEEMKQSASGEVFLDTVTMLVITEEAFSGMDSLRNILRPGVNICQGVGAMNPEAAVKYLNAHTPAQTLLHMERTHLPKLICEKERFRIEP